MHLQLNVNDLVREPINWAQSIDPWSRTDLSQESKIVAVDFDETISDNEGAWLAVMRLLEQFGYTVYVVTWRSPQTAPQELQFLADKGYRIFYTSWKAKRLYMEALGIQVAIWIDDNPFAIENDAIEIWN